MPSRYHPIEDGLWDDPKFDATEMVGEAPGEERGFFAFLTSNKMQRPAGIYRATDHEIAAAGRYPEKRVRSYLADLERRDLIVRDGSWIFLPGYWKRQAHNPGMLKAARKSVISCSSVKVLDSFFQHYPIYKQWFPNGWQTVTEPSSKICPTEQSRAEQSRAYICDADNESRNGSRKQAIGVLRWLNQKAGKNFSTASPQCDANLRFILARLSDGYEDWQLKAVVSLKVREWSGDRKMRGYLRPATLFNQEKFSQYVGELPGPEKEIADDVGPELLGHLPLKP